MHVFPEKKIFEPTGGSVRITPGDRRTKRRIWSQSISKGV
jgi:hypothetical protein